MLEIVLLLFIVISIEEFNKLSNYKQLSVIFNSTTITKVANIYGKTIEINTNIYLYLGKHKIRLYKSNIKFIKEHNDYIKHFVIYNNVCNITVYEFTNDLIIKAE